MIELADDLPLSGDPEKGKIVGEFHASELVFDLGDGCIVGDVDRVDFPAWAVIRRKARTLPARPRQPPVPCTRSQPAVVVGLHLRPDMGRDGLCRFRH